MSDGESEIDDFAQNILRRARLRSQVLNPDSAGNKIIDLPDLKKKGGPGPKPQPEESLKILPVLSHESAHTRKVKTDPDPSLDKSPKMIDDDTEEAAAESSSSEEENKVPVEVPMSVGRRRAFKRLGELYGEEGTMPSPVRDHTIGEKTPDPTPQLLCPTADKSGGRRGRLHALASTINGWEDDLTHYCSPASRFNLSPPRQARKSTASRGSPHRLNFGTPEAVGNSGNGRVSTAYASCNSNKGGSGSPSILADKRRADTSYAPKAKASLKVAFETSNSSLNGDPANIQESGSVWDRSILTALEAQGFVSNGSKTKLTYDYNEEKDNTLTEGSPGRARSVSPSKHASLYEQHISRSAIINNRSASTSPQRKPCGSPVRNMPVSSTPIDRASPIRSPPKAVNVHWPSVAPSIPVDGTPRGKLSVAQKTALFETRGPSGSCIFLKQKDPTEMTVAERAKLFEQQAFQAGAGNKISHSPVRPNMFNRVAKPANPTSASPASPKKVSAQVSLPKGTVENQRRLFENAEARRAEPEAEPEREPDLDLRRVSNLQQQLVVVLADTPPPMFIPPPPPAPPPMNLSVTFSALASQAGSPPRRSRSRSRSPQKALQQSTTPKRGASPSPPRLRSPKAKYPGLRTVKRVRVNEPKPGRMYPSLTDIESTETETEGEMNPNEEFELDYDTEEEMDSETSHISGFSLGTHIEQVAKQNTPRRNPHFRPTEDFSTSLACRQIDEFIDDALEGQSFAMDTIMETELNAPASSTPIACSTSLETSGLQDGTQGAWQVSEELALLSGDESSSSKTLEENTVLDMSCLDEDKPSNRINSGPLSTVPEEPPPAYDGPETNIDALFEESGSGHGDDEEGEASTSFEYTNTSALGQKDSSPVVTSSPIYTKQQMRRQPSPVTTPLVHTVSFFRKQQGQAMSTTPRKALQISDPVSVPSPGTKAGQEMESVNQTIRKLEDEIAAQNRSIGQVSKALSLCKSTIEFNESTENVECERVLLIATQKRTGIVNEIQRLKTEGVLSKLSVLSPTKQELGPSCRGNMTLSGIEVQLKREFFNKAMSGDTVYHFIVLAKYHAQLEASSLISIGNGLSSSKIQGGVLHFTNSFTMGSLEPDFQVKLEVYVLQTAKQDIPHEAKYHIKRPEAKRMTPKKPKHESMFSRAVQQSPAGPDAVRTTNFALCGSLTIDISTLQRNHWDLEGVRYSSPLEGSVAIRIQCCAEGGTEEHGFLTMFDDVSGLGAWHRRWCKLTPSHLAYWMYPEDEVQNKIPIGTIPLRYCVTSRVGKVGREVCARANTLVLITTRAPQEKDRDSLTTSCHKDYTAVRHLLAADTPEDRNAWCGHLNRALANIRAWDPHAHSPDDSLFPK